MRLDLYLVQNGHATSRARAAFLVESGGVTVNGEVCKRVSRSVGEQCEVAVIEQVLPYVSRGGLKLHGALQDFGFLPDDRGDLPDMSKRTVEGAIVLDIGSSTGGFADCLLQHGAAVVYAVDTGHDQLHPELRKDGRVISLEGRNARDLTTDDIPQLCNLCTIDVSFTSQTLLYSSIVPLLAPEACVISLIKPQFEAGRNGLTRSGKVRSSAILRRVLDDVIQAAQLHGLEMIKLVPSRQLGGEGTEEWFGLFVKG